MSSSFLRSDLQLVADLIPAGSRVLDLGCGPGVLLGHLMSDKGCTGTGVDSDDDQVLQAIRRGVPVIEMDLDAELDQFADDSYDTVVLSRTIQAVRHPARVLQQMGRIGSRCIVSAPNFGWWRNRMTVLRGRMPISDDLPYTWYDSPNVRYTTLADLEDFFAEVGFFVEQRIPLTERQTVLPWPRATNLLAGSAVYVLRTERPEAGTGLGLKAR